MIFVTFGNSPMPFIRLAKAVDNIARNLHEPIFVQSGYTDYDFKFATHTKFLTQDEFYKYLSECSVAIMQGGWGGIAEASSMGCKIIAVPRIMGIEHHHDQGQLVNALEHQNILIGCYDVTKLNELISKAKIFDFAPIKKGDGSKIISEFIDYNSEKII